MNIAVKTNDRFVTVDGLNTRYFEEGPFDEGPFAEGAFGEGGGVPAIMLHGSSLGSSADVFRRNVAALGKQGRAIAFDLPGFGKTDPSEDLGGAYRKKFILRFMDALGLRRAALIGHSSSGNPTASLALENPDRVSHVIILGTGSLLPPLETAGTKVGGREESAQARLEDRMVKQEPTLEDTRALLAANLFHHELITDEELMLRHQNSIGRCFTEFVRRHAAGAEGGGNKGGKVSVPMWQRLVEIKQPLLLIFGRNDRARAEERATLLKERYPQLNLHFAEGCKHLVPWDAADLFHQLAVPFLKGR